MAQNMIAKRYAEALSDLLEDARALEEAAAAVRTLAHGAVADHEARLYWQSLSVPHARKRELLSHLLEATGAPPPVGAFVEVLLANNRVADLPEIADWLDAALAERLGQAVATVTSAHPLSPDQQEAVRDRLAARHGKDVLLVTRVDDRLVGGVRVRLENRIIDDSIQGRLAALAHQFKE
jgi:F-type H+-transporting ATPase subunit delta